MAVIMSLVSVLLIVLAITCNQGAARSVDRRSIDSNDFSSSEESSTEAGGVRTYMIPKVMRKDYAITLKGTINTNDPMFIVELPSVSGQKSCQFKFDYEKQVIHISPAVKLYEKTDYGLGVKPGSKGIILFHNKILHIYPLSLEDQEIEDKYGGSSFTLTIVARKDRDNNDMLGMTFDTVKVGPSRQLLCNADFRDINKVVIKEGVAHVDSLLFEYKRVSESAEN